MYSRNAKAVLQMTIGMAAVMIVGWYTIYTTATIDLTSTVLSGIGFALAAAAALELTYTLFTPGPDEAINPLMLAVAAALLLQLASIKDTATFSSVGVLLLLGGLLAALFFVRLLFIEPDNDSDPNIWRIMSRHNWPNRLHSQINQRSAPPAQDLILQRLWTEVIEPWWDIDVLGCPSSSLVFLKKDVGGDEYETIRFAVYETLIAVLSVIEDGNNLGTTEGAHGWALIEIDGQGRATGRQLSGLAERVERIKSWSPQREEFFEW